MSKVAELKSDYFLNFMMKNTKLSKEKFDRINFGTKIFKKAIGLNAHNKNIVDMLNTYEIMNDDKLSLKDDRRGKNQAFRNSIQMFGDLVKANSLSHFKKKK